MKSLNWIVIFILGVGSVLGGYLSDFSEAWFSVAIGAAFMWIPLFLVNIGFMRSGFWSCLLVGVIGVIAYTWQFDLLGLAISSVLLLNAYGIYSNARSKFAKLL